jgi:hypothetical protein
MVSCALTIEFERLANARADLPAMVGVEADVHITVDGVLFFSEESLTVIELAYCLLRWIRTLRVDEHANFVYDAMETEEPPLSFVSNGDGYWTLSSPWRKSQCAKRFTLETLLQAATRFVHDVELSCRDELGIDVNQVFSEAAR